MQTPFDTLFEQSQPDTTKIFAAPFLILDRISKRALLLLLRFQKIIICESAGIFVAQQYHKNPGFFFFKKGADSQHPFLSRSPFSGRAAFLFSEHTIPRLKKGAGGNGGYKLFRERYGMSPMQYKKGGAK